jgi:hypothetical protein
MEPTCYKGLGWDIPGCPVCANPGPSALAAADIGLRSAEGTASFMAAARAS